MAGARLIIAWLGVCLAAGCGNSAPPTELSGLWSPGQAACAAGVGVRFEANAIQAVYEDGRQTLFDRPHYSVEESGEAFRVRITYELPRITGGARSVGAHGILVLVRGPDGIAPASHNLIDARTGAARMRFVDDPAARALTLQPCGAHSWREDLRGRGDA